MIHGHNQKLVQHAIAEIFRNRPLTFQRAVFQGIDKAYKEPQRRYHTLRHIGEMLEQANTFVLSDKRAFLAAVLFHDYTYEPERSAPGYKGASNEEQSAFVCDYILTEGDVEEPVRERAKQLIVMTETHKAPEGDEEARLFMDIDMSIVAADFVRYGEYAGETAHEYLSVFTPEQYIAGRMAFLAKTLDKGPVFKTAHFAAREERAAHNITWEMQNLGTVVAITAMSKQTADYDPKNNYK